MKIRWAGPEAGGVEKRIARNFGGKRKGNNHLENLQGDGTVILK